MLLGATGRKLLSLVSTLTLATPALALGEEVVDCGQQEKHRVIAHAELPTPEPSEGKALVYAMRKERASIGDVQMKLVVNGEYKAVLKKDTYTFFEVQPGLLRVCWTLGKKAGQAVDALFLTAEAGQTYYLLGKFYGGLSPGVGGAGLTGKHLAELSPEEGKELLKKLKHITFERKR